jgi:hypothetical protein
MGDEAKTKLSVRELVDLLETQRFNIPRGSYWKHTASGRVYEVLDHQIREADAVVLISYVTVPTERDHPYLEKVHFSRPASEWREIINDKPRFFNVVPVQTFEQKGFL